MIAAIIQARMGSTRLPGKTLMDLNGMTVLARLVSRLRECKTLDKIIVATTTHERDNTIEVECEKLHAFCFRGSEDDVLSRVLEAAQAFSVDHIVEITADCPLMDWDVVDSVVHAYVDINATGHCDMAVNFMPKCYPKGYEVRVFSTELLAHVNEEVDNPIDRQHVSTWIFWNPKASRHYTTIDVPAPHNATRPDLAITLDTPEDYELIRTLCIMGKEYNLPLTVTDVINLIDTYPNIYAKVQTVPRNDYHTEIMKWYTENAPKLKPGRPTGHKNKKKKKASVAQTEKKAGRVTGGQK